MSIANVPVPLAAACPFCGQKGPKVADTLRPFFHEPQRTVWLVRCQNCHSQGPFAEPDLAAAVEAWNRRVTVGGLGPCIFRPCVATWRHWHGGFPGGYDNPADPEGAPILFTGDDPDPSAVRDYNGAALPRHPTGERP